MKFRHFAFAFAVFPLVGLTYACSKSNVSSGDNPGNTGEPSPDGSDADNNVDNGGDTDTVNTGDNNTGINGDTDTGANGDTDMAGDTDPGNPGGSGANPLTTGPSADGFVVTTHLDVIGAMNGRFSDPRYFEDAGVGYLVCTSAATPSQLIRVNVSSGEQKPLRTLSSNTLYFDGNAIKGDRILTTQSDHSTTGSIVQTTFDGADTADSISTAPSTNPGSLTVGPQGDLYFTNGKMGGGGGEIYRVSLQPTPTVTSIASISEVANFGFFGIAFSPDAKRLYVAEHTGPDGSIVYWPVNFDGSVESTYTELATTTGYGTGGIAVDTGGNVWVAEGDGSTNGRVEVFAPDGIKHGEINFAGEYLYGIAFGGTDNKTVFIVGCDYYQSCSIHTYQSSIPGIR